MLEEFIDKLIVEVHSILDLHHVQSNPLKYYTVQASLYTTAITKLNEKLIDHRFQSIEEEISFFKFAKPKLVIEQYYSYHIAEQLCDCQNLSKDATDEYIRYQIQTKDNFFSRHKEFSTYLSLDEDKYDEIYFTRLSKRSKSYFDLYLVDKDFRTISEKGYIISLIESNKRLSIYFQSLLEKATSKNALDGQIIINKLDWNGSQTDLVELIYALKAAGCLNNTLLNISDVLSQVFGSGNIDIYKIWNRIKNRKTNSTRLLYRLLESLSEQIQEEKEP